MEEITPKKGWHLNSARRNGQDSALCRGWEGTSRDRKAWSMCRSQRQLQVDWQCSRPTQEQRGHHGIWSNLIDFYGKWENIGASGFQERSDVRVLEKVNLCGAA